MNRISLVLATVLLAVLPGFAQYSFTGTGVEDIELIDASFTGNSETNLGAAALIQNVSTLHVGSTELTGSGGGALGGFGLWVIGAGETRIDGGSVLDGGTAVDFTSDALFSGTINMFGGFGAGLIATGPSNTWIFSDTTIYGGSAGVFSNSYLNITTNEVVVRAEVIANGNSGIAAIGGILKLENNVKIFGGQGGAAIVEFEEIVTNSVVNGGDGIWVNGNSVLLVSDEVNVFGGNGGLSDAGAFSVANASGGNGLYLTNTTSSVLIGGSYTGGDGGTVIGLASSVAAGGAGVSIDKSTGVTIAGGTYAGGAGGTVNGILGVSDRAVNIIDSDVHISAGTFNGNVEVSGSGASTLNISGGEFGGEILFSGSGTSTVSLENSWTNISTKIKQTAGMVNVSDWNASHFLNTEIYGGEMSFDKKFDLESGSSFALLAGDEGTVNFGEDFLAKSNSTIITTFDKTADNSSVIEGRVLEFQEGSKWNISGMDGATVEAGDVIEMAVASSSLIDTIDASTVEYIGNGSSWMATITDLSRSGNTLSGLFNYVAFEDALELESGSGFYEAMEQLSAYTAITNFSNGSKYLPLKALSAEEANTILFDGYVRAPEMANALIRSQGLFSDQITDRSRSYRRYKSSAGSSSAPKGPSGWSDSLPRKYEIPESYQVWGRGYGSYFDQSGTTGFGGYTASVGGGVMGLDKRFSNLLLGLGGGYAHTSLNGNWGSDGEADTGYGTVYAAINGEKAFLDFNFNYAFNDVETEGSPVMGYEGEYNANTMGLYIGGGMDFSTFNDSMLFTPEVSLLSTYYDREGYTETATAAGPYPDKVWDAYDQWSYLSSLGATLSMIHQIESFDLEMEFQPEVRAHWLHEFNADMDADSYVMEGGTTPIGVALQAREEDLIKVGAGVRFSKWNSDTLEFGLDFDGIFGEDYEAYIFSGKLLHRF